MRKFHWPDLVFCFFAGMLAMAVLPGAIGWIFG